MKEVKRKAERQRPRREKRGETREKQGNTRGNSGGLPYYVAQRSKKQPDLMRVYRITSDVNQYQYFLTEHEEDVEQFEMDGTPKGETWVPPAVFVFKPRHKAGDFYQFYPGILITSPEATEALRTHLEMAGELLPLPYGDAMFTVLNVTECINCLDQARTEWLRVEETGQKIYPQKYVFHANRFTESALFKIPETARGEILLVEGLDVPEEEFRYVVEQANLKGLLFEVLWESDEA